LCHDLQRYDEAERLYKEALEQRTRFLGEQHTETLTTMNNLAFFYLDRERFAEAKPLYATTSETLRRVLGEKDKNAVISLAMLGLCELKLGRPEEAKQLLSVAFDRGRLGLRGHWMQYAIQSLLGEAMAELGERQQARRTLLAAYQGLKKSEPALSDFWKRLVLQAAAKRLASMQQTPDKSQGNPESSSKPEG
jgi:tetratricopeptide (TPR) repeat protein